MARLGSAGHRRRPSGRLASMPSSRSANSIAAGRLVFARRSRRRSARSSRFVCPALPFLSPRTRLVQCRRSNSSRLPPRSACSPAGGSISSPWSRPAMKFGWIAMPDQLRALDVLASNWVIGIAGSAAPWPNSSPTRSPGSTAPGTRSIRSSARWAAPAQPRHRRCRRSRLPGRQLPARRRRGLRRPCRQGRRAGDRQRLARALLQRRRLDRRGHRHRRPACAGHRQPGRGGADQLVLVGLSLWLVFAARRLVGASCRPG